MTKRLSGNGYVMVAFLKDGREFILHSSLRSRRKNVIEHAKATFFGGGKSWPYIKRQGWRLQKVKITAVQP